MIITAYVLNAYGWAGLYYFELEEASSWWKNPDLLSRSQESGQRPETEARKDRFDDAGWGSVPCIRNSLNAFLIPTAPLVGPELDTLDFRMVFNIGLSPFSRCEI